MGQLQLNMQVFSATDADATMAVSDGEITEIMAWLAQLPRPTTGEALYLDFCGNCHGPKSPTIVPGGGGAIPVKVTGLKMSEVSTTVRTGDGTDPGAREYFMPKFDATAITDAELALIQTFLASTP